MKLHGLCKQFSATIQGKEVSSGGIGLLVSDETPPCSWIKDFQLMNACELRDSEVHALIDAVIAGKTELPIRDGSIVLQIKISERRMDINQARA